ncbi:thylakoid lumenal kDa chloroplastic [Micractinium conductrix]|uniref:Thylakoid lumenal kDa chloroplastic n=1 Tax=Micractinium conductrix TaxID=554055 RepID=A0A2P6VPK3_9CHLO|nr:thylakoid lumenal kDa chloroplastic [Micractinium conductrix]|eukprot:PSC76021.1 thylakoid lumenal kDa chloroplastic [Micractinium conductrix]
MPSLAAVLAAAAPQCRPFVAGQQPRRQGAAVRVVCSAQERSGVLERAAKGAAAVALSALLAVGGASARLEGVNKPELLPKGEFTPVIDVAGFLTDGEERRIRQRVDDLERDTGVKLRVLAQNYPQTPGLAIKDYWGVDADTVVFVADPNTGNILNFNVGENVDFKVPRSFWSRLAGRYGTKFYWQDNGQDLSIVNAVAAIDNCVREPMGRAQCSTIRGELE